MTEETEKKPFAEFDNKAYFDSLLTWAKDNQPTFSSPQFYVMNNHFLTIDSSFKVWFWNAQFGIWYPNWQIQELVQSATTMSEAA